MALSQIRQTTSPRGWTAARLLEAHQKAASPAPGWLWPRRPRPALRPGTQHSWPPRAARAARPAGAGQEGAARSGGHACELCTHRASPRGGRGATGRGPGPGGGSRLTPALGAPRDRSPPLPRPLEWGERRGRARRGTCRRGGERLRRSGFTAAPAVPPARPCAGLAPREQPEGASAAAGLSEQPERRLTCGALSSCPPQLAKDLLHPSLENERRKHKKKRLVQSPNSYFMDVKCPGKHLKCLCLTEGVKLILYAVHLH